MQHYFLMNLFDRGPLSGHDVNDLAGLLKNTISEKVNLVEISAVYCPASSSLSKNFTKYLKTNGCPSAPVIGKTTSDLP